MSPRGSRDSHDRSLLKVELRPPAADVQARLHERDQRQAGDTRSETQRYLGDPEPGRSALAHFRSSSDH
jgi:hypothetical protein